MMFFYVIFNFSLGVAVDLLYVLWMKAVADDKKPHAVLWSVLISVCSIYGFLNAVDYRWLTIPYIIGLGVGTYIGMLFGKKGKNN